MSKIQTVYVVMAVEGHHSPTEKQTCYCVCDNSETANEVIKVDTEKGDIHPNASIEIHELQTKELV